MTSAAPGRCSTSNTTRCAGRRAAAARALARAAAGQAQSPGDRPGGSRRPCDDVIRLHSSWRQTVSPKDANARPHDRYRDRSTLGDFVDIAALVVSITALAATLLTSPSPARTSPASRTHLPAVVGLFQEHRGAELARARHIVANELVGRDLSDGLAAVPEEYRQHVLNLCWFYDNIGALVAHGVVPLAPVSGLPRRLGDRNLEDRAADGPGRTRKTSAAPVPRPRALAGLLREPVLPSSHHATARGPGEIFTVVPRRFTTQARKTRAGVAQFLSERPIRHSRNALSTPFSAATGSNRPRPRSGSDAVGRCWSGGALRWGTRAARSGTERRSAHTGPERPHLFAAPQPKSGSLALTGSNKKLLIMRRSASLLVCLGMGNRQSRSWIVSDELWSLVEPLLPKPGPKKVEGRSRVPDWQALCGILFVLHTGIQWSTCPTSSASLGHDLLATPGGLERGRRLGPAPPAAAERAAVEEPAGLGTGGDRLLARASRPTGPKSGPSPVDRARPGSKHHLMVSREAGEA